MPANRESYDINVLTQNVMLDKTLEASKRILPQALRIGSVAATLNRFGSSLDIVGVQEAQKFEGRHYGEELANASGHGPGFWFEHNPPRQNPRRGRKGEYMGMYGSMVDRVEPIELSDNRKALLSVIDGVAYVTYHLRAGVSRRSRLVRVEEAGQMVEAVEEYNDAVFFGDSNEPNIPRIAWARQVFAHAGFESALDIAGNESIKTFPASDYRRIRRVPRIRLDEISVRGDRISVLGAGALRSVAVDDPEAADYPESVPRAPSDHDALWASLRISPQI